MKKALGFLLLSGFIVAGCSCKDTNFTQQESAAGFNYLNTISSDQIQNIYISADSVIDISDVEELRDFTTNIFLGTVESLDGCSTTIVNGTFNPIPSTYGKVNVLENLKGTIKTNSVTFAKPGGTLSIAEYEKNAPIEMIENDDKHRKDAGQENIDKANTYMHYEYENDIPLEVGKTYLFFCMYNEDTGVYAIDGIQYGSREVQSSSRKKLKGMPSDTSALQIKNNDTGEYTSYSKFLETYFE